MAKIPTLVFILLLSTSIAAVTFPLKNNDRFVSYTVDSKLARIKLYWKDGNGRQISSLGALNKFVSTKAEKLLFAMNGGMYKTDGAPLGLYIQDSKTLAKINRSKGKGNFYLQPNGVFFITVRKEAGICRTPDFNNRGNIQYATQSGPLLLENGHINPLFTKGSANLNIRNGVGILPGDKILFAMSNVPVNFYDFADFFKQAGCSNALYLDGFVSRTYLPEKNWIQTDGNFGVMIGITTNR